MKIYGSISRLVSVIFRKDGQDLSVRPNQSTTYTAARDVQLPVGDADHELVGTEASQTLKNKSMSGDDNSFSNIHLASLKVKASDADKLILRDVSGAVVSAKLENKHVSSSAAIAFSKMASLTASKVLVSDANGVVSASSISSTELGQLAGISSNVQAQLDTKATSAALNQAVSDLQASIASEQSARQSADSSINSKIDNLTTNDIAEGSNKYFTDARAKAAVVVDTGYTGTETNKSLSVRAVVDAISDVNSAIDSLQSSMEAADAALSSDISSEASARQSADSDLQDAIDQEVSDRQAAVSSEASARQTADAALDARLDVLEGPDSQAGSVAKALKDAKAYTDAETSARQSAVSSEASARQAADSTLQSHIDALQSSMEAADSALDARLDVIEGPDSQAGSLAKALKDAKAYSDQKIADLVNSAPAILDTLKELADAINDDAHFATTVANNIASEASRAEAAESLLQSHIDSEASARQAADSDLQDAIDAEQAAREAADSAQDAEIAKKLNKPTSGDAANKYLRSNGDGSTFWDVGYILPVYKTTWSASSGMSKVVSHNLGSSDVVVSFIDLADNQIMGVSSVVITDDNTITCSASEAPSASGWRVIVQKM